MLVICRNCMEVFDEREAIYDGDEDMDFCPKCGEGGCLTSMNEWKRFEALKKELINGGKRCVEDFIGYELNGNESHELINDMLNEVYEQMPDDTLEEFYKGYYIV